jgi:GTPase KRas protein
LYNAREVSTEEARVLAMRLGCDFYETSAKANTNVEAAFKSLVRQIKGTKRGYEGGAVAGGKVGGKKKKCVIL